jgi:type II secretory pathway component GspD/PulD (secretin)
MMPEPFTCEQSLRALASLPAAEIQSNRALARHAEACPDCSRVAAVVLERERSLALALDSLRPRTDPARLADTVALAAERHGTARFVKWLLIAAMAATAWFALDNTIGEHERKIADLRTETFQLNCLSPEQAEGLIEPYLRADGHGIYFTNGVNSVTVRARPTELVRARQVISDAQIRRATETGSCSSASLPPSKP